MTAVIRPPTTSTRKTILLINNTTSNITAKTIQNEAATMTTTTTTINATLVGNLAILLDIMRKLDIIAEILADQDEHPFGKTETTQDHDGKL